MLFQEFTFFVLVFGFKPDSWCILPSMPGCMNVPSFKISSLVMVKYPLQLMPTIPIDANASR
ncbi:MAG: hypothetical protein WCS13_05985 [Candidatus Cloacimonadaceae bacterium]